MNRFLVRNLLYPLHECLRGRPTAAFLARFRRSERMSTAELEAEHRRLLLDLVRHAVANVPFWRDAFRKLAIDPARFDLDRDFSSLPILTKATIRAEGRRLVADDYKDRVFQLATGGSSGEPLIFHTDKRREASQLAAKLRAREWWGIRWGDRQTDLWGSPIEIGAQDKFRTFKDGLLNFRLLSAFKLSDELMAGFKKALVDHRTDFLYGYASVLDRYARFLDARGDNLHALSLKGAVSTAEVLFPEQRERTKRVFGCPVINEYGCRDGGFIAQECPEGAMHIAYDTMHVEILDGDRPVKTGEVGDIAVTNLWSYGMPMMRYRLGDRARLLDEHCRCGRPYPLLGALEGRTTDTLFSPDGNRIHGLGAMYVIRVLEGVERFQVIQEKIDGVRVLLVVQKTADRAAIERSVKTGLEKVLGERSNVTVEFVDEIAVLASGKMRSIVNLCPDL